VVGGCYGHAPAEHRKVLVHVGAGQFQRCQRRHRGRRLGRGTAMDEQERNTSEHGRRDSEARVVFIGHLRHLPSQKWARRRQATSAHSSAAESFRLDPSRVFQWVRLHFLLATQPRYASLTLLRKVVDGEVRDFFLSSVGRLDAVKMRARVGSSRRVPRKGGRPLFPFSKVQPPPRRVALPSWASWLAGQPREPGGGRRDGTAKPRPSRHRDFELEPGRAESSRVEQHAFEHESVAARWLDIPRRPAGLASGVRPGERKPKAPATRSKSTRAPSRKRRRAARAGGGKVMAQNIDAKKEVLRERAPA